jgi:hypothetical protein
VQEKLEGGSGGYAAGRNLGFAAATSNGAGRQGERQRLARVRRGGALLLMSMSRRVWKPARGEEGVRHYGTTGSAGGRHGQDPSRACRGATFNTAWGAGPRDAQLKRGPVWGWGDAKASDATRHAGHALEREAGAARYDVLESNSIFACLTGRSSKFLK